MTVYELGQMLVSQHPHEPAIRYPARGWSWTFGDLWHLSSRVQLALQHVGLVKGDTLALMLPGDRNCPAGIALFFAAAQVGLCVSFASMAKLLSTIWTQRRWSYGRVMTGQTGFA